MALLGTSCQSVVACAGAERYRGVGVGRSGQVDCRRARSVGVHAAREVDARGSVTRFEGLGVAWCLSNMLNAVHTVLRSRKPLSGKLITSKYH